MSNKSNQPPPQRTQAEEHAPKPSLPPNIDHVPHGLVTAAVRRYNDLGNATSSLPSSRPSSSEDFDKKEDKDEDVFQLDQLSLVHSTSRSSIENMDQVAVADAVEIDPNDTDDIYSTDDSADTTDDNTLSYSPSEDSDNDTDSAHKEEAPKTIITEEPKTVITVMDKFDNNLYDVRDNPNTHQQIHSQMMSKTIEDLPNEMINKIFDYLDESDVIHTGLAYNRLSRHKVVGDKIGRKYFMPAIQHSNNSKYYVCHIIGTFFIFLQQQGFYWEVDLIPLTKKV